MKKPCQYVDVSMYSSNDLVSQAMAKVRDLVNGSGIAVHDYVCRTSTVNDCLNADDVSDVCKH